MLVIGIDLTGVETRPSGFCVINTELMRAETNFMPDNEIIKETEKLKQM